MTLSFGTLPPINERILKPAESLYQLLLLFVLENAEAVGLYYNGIEDCGEFYFIILSLDDDRLFYLYHFTINTIRRLFS